MKKALVFLSLLLWGLIFLPGYVSPDHPEVAAAGPKVKYSKKVNAVIQDKCFGCHNAEGRNEKAKQKLSWDKLPDMAADEQKVAMDEILEVLEKGNMPPARFLEGNPDKKLTEAETALLKKWAEKTAKKVAK